MHLKYKYNYIYFPFTAEYTFREFHSAMVFPSTKPLPKAGTGGQFPDVFVKYTVSSFLMYICSHMTM